MKWNDEIRRGVVEASTIKIGAFKLVVHHYIGYPPELWMATCHDLFSQKEMPGLNLEESKTKAVSILKNILEKSLNEINNGLE